MFKTLLIAAAAAVIAGCGVQTDLKQPDPTIAASYPAELQPGGSGTPAAAIGWREYFADPRLQALIGAALEHNRDLRIAVARVDEARARYGIERAAQWPTIEAGAAAVRSRAGAGSTPSRVEHWQANLGVTSFELDFWGRVRSLKDAALGQYLATDEARRAFTLALIGDVAETHLTVVELDERIALAARTLASRQASQRIVRARHEAGTTTSLDLRQVETLLAQAGSELAALQRQRAQALQALALLVGGPLPEQPAALSLADQGMRPLPAGYPSELLARRPDILAAEQRLRAAHAEIGAARAAFFPRITLTGAFGTASSELDGLFGSGSRAWSLAPQITLPIFDAGRNRAVLEVSQARRDAAVADYERTVQGAFREVADALAARRWLAEQLEHQQAGLAAHAERARLADERYRGGVASHLDVLDAERELFAAGQGVLQTRRAMLGSAVALYRALGGGAEQIRLAEGSKR